METGEFLTAGAGSAQPVTMSVSGGADNTQWTLVESGEFFNIDSESTSGGTGILSAPGAVGSTGPYVILSTLKAPPAGDTDKTWSIAYNGATDTYRFGSRVTGRYLYQNADGTVTHSQAEATDNRSNWRLSPFVETPVGAAAPRFSWKLTQQKTVRGQKQTAYQILVASSLDKLTQNNGDFWDSGKIASDQSVNVVYAGESLESSKRYYWKVKVWPFLYMEPVRPFFNGPFKPNDRIVDNAPKPCKTKPLRHFSVSLDMLF